MRRLVLALALIALACAAAWSWSLLQDEQDDGHDVTIERDEGKVDSPPPPVTLRGRPGAEPAPEAKPSDGPGPMDVLVPVALSHPPSAEAVSPIDFARLKRTPAQIWAADGPRAPERPHHPNPDVGDPTRRASIQRHDLVEGGLLVEGVVTVEDGDAEDEIEDPLVTAVTGRVVSGEDPVRSAEVIVYSTFYLRHARYDRHVREVGRCFTDADGNFDLRPIGLDTVHFGADGEVLLTVHGEGHGSIVARRLDNLQPEQVNDLGTFVLTRDAATVEGVVLDLEGKPIVGAAVRVSGAMNPVIYDKTERMVVLKDCPCAITDEEGRYHLASFAPGRQMVSIHVNIDCVQRLDTTYAPGVHSWSPRVQAGRWVKGRVIDGYGDGIAKAVVSGGGNWTPTNPDGTFWLDNVEEGPFSIETFHHAFRRVLVPSVATGEERLEIVMASALPRIRLRVTAEETGYTLPLIAIDWAWQGGGPHQFVPVSRYWHAKDGVVEVIVPENTSSALVSAAGYAAARLEAGQLADGLEHGLLLARP